MTNDASNKVNVDVLQAPGGVCDTVTGAEGGREVYNVVTGH